MQAITRLIIKIASQPSTEELILFIADDDEIVKACLELQKQLDLNDSHNLARLETLCRSHQISLDMLSKEIHRIVAIFAPGSVNDEYTVLGLETGADPEQVKQAFRRLSIKYHPDSSGSDTSEKFIKICQAYKAIISRSGTSESTSNHQKSSSWRYKKKRGLSSRQKKKNIYLFSTLAAILFIISVIAPFIYKKKVMLHHLNNSNPMLITQAAIDEEPLTEKKAKNRDEGQETRDKQTESFVAAEDIRNKPPVPITQEFDTQNPEPAPVRAEADKRNEPPAQITLKSDIQPPKPAPVRAELENRNEPPVAIMSESEVLKPQPTVQKQKTAAQILEVKTQKAEPVIAQSEIREEPPVPVTTEPDILKLQPRARKQKVKSKIQEVKTRSPKPVKNNREPGTINPVSLNNFIHAYSAAYENKNFQQFALFFTPDALENGHSFAGQQDKYNQLFQSVDTITLDIGILSSTIEDKNIQLIGRFQINLTYPQRQPIQLKGQIFFLLTNNDQLYKVKELSYTFDKIE